MLSKEQEKKRQMILDHYENPKYMIKTKTPKYDKYLNSNMQSPSCIDNITVYMNIKNNKIADIAFEGNACAIATSTTDIMCSEIINKPIADAKKIIKNYLDMIDNKKYDNKIIGVLNIFDGVNKNANRIKCATVGINAINKILKTLK